MVVDCGCRASRRRENIEDASERENFWLGLTEPTNEFSKIVDQSAHSHMIWVFLAWEGFEIWRKDISGNINRRESTCTYFISLMKEILNDPKFQCIDILAIITCHQLL